MNLDTLLKKYYGENYYGNSRFMNIVEDILDRIEDFNDEELITYAIDDSLIYYADQWEVLMFYFVDPTEANWEQAYEMLYNDILSLVNLALDSKSY